MKKSISLVLLFGTLSLQAGNPTNLIKDIFSIKIQVSSNPKNPSIFNTTDTTLLNSFVLTGEDGRKITAGDLRTQLLKAAVSVYEQSQKI